MEVNIKNLILLIELEQFEEDAKAISKTIRFVLKKITSFTQFFTHYLLLSLSLFINSGK